MQGTSHRAILQIAKPFIVLAAFFSVVLNVLFLVTPIYMLQVYDRVLTTGSVPTLVVLSAISLFLMGVFLFADAGRRRVMNRLAQELDERLMEKVVSGGFSDPKKTPADTLQMSGKLAQIQQILNQGAPGALLDLPFTPLFMVVMFAVHPLIGVVGLVGAIILVALALLNENMSKAPMQEAGAADKVSTTTLSQLMRQRSAVVGMGMIGRSVGRWAGMRQKVVDAQVRAGVPSNFIGAATRSVRLSLQLIVLGAGAYLAIQGTVSPGAIIAGSIIMGRALAPIDQIVNGWRALITAGRAVGSVDDWLAEERDMPEDDITALPRPTPQLTLEGLAAGLPGADKPMLPPVDHKFEPGRLIVLLGASGAGKSTLLQTLAGAWPAADGSVLLGARDLHRWPSEDRGQYVGYLPQHVQLLPGTVRENIARFQDCDAEEVFAAAKSVGCHELILSLKDGYDTQLGEGGVTLSAGQSQAVGLARAFFGAPPLLLLDEPTAHLDANLAASLMQHFAQAARKDPAERSFTAIVATHDMRLVNAADDVMLISDRKVLIRPRESYMQQISQLRERRAANAVTQGSAIGKEPGNA